MHESAFCGDDIKVVVALFEGRGKGCSFVFLGLLIGEHGDVMRGEYLLADVIGIGDGLCG